MADLSDIESVLVSTIAAIAYPNGTASPSIANAPVFIARGWPMAAKLDRDLAAGKINITVYPQDTEKRTTKYARDWMTLSVPSPSITLTASNNTITITGTPTALQNACVVVNGTAYIYPIQTGDTLQGIATGLATQINADTPATSSGGTISIPAAHSIASRVGTVASSILEIRRQKRNFQISFWCANPQARDLIASAVDDALAGIDFLTLPDGSYGRLLYERSHVGDASEKEGLYRRDLFYSVEYATTQARNDGEILAPHVGVADFLGNPAPAPQPTFAWDFGRWDDGISRWISLPTSAWDAGEWDDGLSAWQGPPAWEAGFWDDARTTWLPANTWEAGNWDNTLNWDS